MKELFVALIIVLVGGRLRVWGITGWTYEPTTSSCKGTTLNPCGPASWGNIPLTQCLSTAASQQSPINIGTPIKDTIIPQGIRKLNLFAKHGGCKRWKQETTIYDFVISTANCTNLGVDYDGDRFLFRSMHMHSPSEHTIAGGHYSAEIQIEHVSLQTGRILVFAVLLQETMSLDVFHSNLGQSNEFLKRFWSAANWSIDGAEATIVHTVNEADEALNIYEEIIPADSRIVSYTGSLTTPPCSEGVMWFLFMEPIAVSDTDMLMLRNAIAAHPDNILNSDGNNNRPIQPLHKRMVSFMDSAEVIEFHYVGPVINATNTTTNTHRHHHLHKKSWEAVGIFLIVVTLVCAAGYALGQARVCDSNSIQSSSWFGLPRTSYERIPNHVGSHGSVDEDDSEIQMTNMSRRTNPHTC